MKVRNLGLLFAILSPIFSSIATIFLSGVSKTFATLAVVSFGAILGGSIIFLLLFLTKSKFSIRDLKKVKKDLAKMVFLRQLLGQALLVLGISLTSAIKAIFFTKTEPYFVLLFHWLVKKEKILKHQIVLLAANLFGALLLSTGGKFEAFGKAQFGDLLIVLAMACLAYSYFYGKKLSLKLGATAANAFALIIAGLVLFPLVLFTTPMSSLANYTGWVYLLGYVITFNVIGLTLWYASLKTVKSWVVSTLRSVGPIVGAPLAYFIFGDVLNLVQIVGVAIILVTSSYIAYEHRK